MADVALSSATALSAMAALLATTPTAATGNATVDPGTGATTEATDSFAALMATLVATPPVATAAATTTPPITDAMPALPTKILDPELSEKAGDQADADTLAAPDDGSLDDGGRLAAMLALIAPPPATPTAPVAPKVKAETTGRSATAMIALAGKTDLPTAPKDDATATDGKDASTDPAEAAPAKPIDPRESARFAAIAAKLMGSTAGPGATATPASAAPAPTIPIVPAPAAAPAVTAQVAPAPAQADPKPATPAIASPPVATASAAPRTARMSDARPSNIGRVGPVKQTAAHAAPAVDVAALVAPVAPERMHAGADAAPAAASTAANATDSVVSGTLSLARDDQWLETLAKDIASTGGKDGQLSFRLDPGNLGQLTIHIVHSADGASIRMTADTDQARSIIADAQPRLAAEARAQGLTLKETSVDVGGSGAGQSGQHQAAQSFASLAGGQSQRDPRADHPFINLNAVEGEDQAATPDADAGRSELYA